MLRYANLLLLVLLPVSWFAPLLRAGLLAIMMLAAAVLYFGVLALSGLNLRQLLRR